MNHVCNADPARGPICSHLATDGVLDALGFPVRRVEKIMGSLLVIREGTTHHAAIHAAFGAGAVRICTRTRRLFDEADVPTRLTA